MSTRRMGFLPRYSRLEIERSGRESMISGRCGILEALPRPKDCLLDAPECRYLLNKLC